MKYQAIAMLLGAAQVAADTCPPEGELIQHCTPYKDLYCSHEFDPPMDFEAEANLGKQFDKILSTISKDCFADPLVEHYFMGGKSAKLTCNSNYTPIHFEVEYFTDSSDCTGPKKNLVIKEGECTPFAMFHGSIKCYGYEKTAPPSTPDQPSTPDANDDKNDGGNPSSPQPSDKTEAPSDKSDDANGSTNMFVAFAASTLAITATLF